MTGISALLASGSSVYAGGDFTMLGLTSRAGLAALDPTTGAVAPGFNPTTGGDTQALALSGSSLFAGGSFYDEITEIGSGWLSAFDPATGATQWSATPVPDDGVNALATSGSRLFAGGQFSTIGGANRAYIAALDTASGAVSSAWNPGADSSINALAVSGSRLFAGGNFSAVAGSTRRGLALLDADTGALDGWDPDVNNGVSAIALGATPVGLHVYAGGQFGLVGGQIWPRFAVFTYPAPSNTAPPTIAGTTEIGQTLSCSSGTWADDPTSFAYAWLRNGSAIEGATAATYALTAADASQEIACRVTAANGGGSASSTSAAVTVAAAPGLGGTTAATESGVVPGPGSPTPPPAPDITPPQLGIALKAVQKLLKVIALGTPVTVTCSEPCTVTVRLLLDGRTAKRLHLSKTVVVGRASGRLATAGKKKVTVKLTRNAKRAFRRLRTVRLTVQATAKDAAGNASKTARKLTLKR